MQHNPITFWQGAGAQTAQARQAPQAPQAPLPEPRAFWARAPLLNAAAPQLKGRPLAMSQSPSSSGKAALAAVPVPAPRPQAVPVTPHLPGTPGAPGAPGAPGGHAAPGARPIRPPVAPTRRRGRHILVMLSFLVLVAGPAIAVGYYLFTYAQDQYASRVGFSIRQEESSSALELLAGITTGGGSSSSDTDILYEFIQSQRLVAELDAELGLRAIWSKPRAIDPVFSVEADAPIEDLVDYWGRMVRLSFGSGSGLLEVEVLAFTPEDAQNIAQAIFRRSSAMINDLSAIAREDAIGYARDELDQALERLKEARARITEFRNENQIVDPRLDLQSQAGLLSTLQEQQAQTLIEIDLLAETARSDDPRLALAERRLEVIERRIAAERQKLGVTAGSAPSEGGTEGTGGTGADAQGFAALLGAYERLAVDLEFAERSYVGALAAYDTSVAEARRQSRYLAAYMEPTLAQTPEYPQRLMLLGLTILVLFLTWAILVLFGYALKDRR